MDTRRKIIASAEALVSAPRPLAIAIARFDPLLVWHVRELAPGRARAATLAAIVLPAILPAEDELLPQTARAALVAGLRMIDYVLTPGATTSTTIVDSLLAQVTPIEVVDLAAREDVRRAGFIAHVHGRQNR